MKPQKPYYLIQLEEEKNITTSGILLAQEKQNSTRTGCIVETHEGSLLKNGENVIFKNWSGEEIEIKNKNYRFVKEKDILATYEM